MKEERTMGDTSVNDPIIYRFEDLRRSRMTAFVIAQSVEEATQLLRLETNKELLQAGYEELNEFPKAVEHYSKYGESVWINNIDPF